MMKHPTSIAILIPHIGKAGAETAIELLLRKADHGLLDIYVIAPKEQPLLSFAHEVGFKILPFDYPKFLGTSVEVGDRRIFNPFATLYDLFLILFTSFQIARILRLYKIQTVYTASIMGHLIGAFACRQTSSKIVCHLQDIIREDLAFGFGNKLMRMFFRSLVDLTVVPSNAVRDSIQPNTRTRVVRYGLDPTLFTDSISTLRDELGIPMDRILIGVIGRLTRWKGQHVLIEAAEQLLLDQYPVLFLIIGGPVFDNTNYQEMLENLVCEKKLEQHILFTGFRQDIPNIMNALDIVVVPSIMPDPSPLVVLEAMACGKPVVGSKVGGIPETIVDGETGVLFTPGDSPELASCLIPLVQNEELRKRLGRTGKQHVQLLFTIEAYTGQMTEILKRTAAGLS